MTNKDLIRLRHMLDSANTILRFLKGKRRASLGTGKMVASAILREFEVLGEAAGKVSPKTQELFPGIPWKQLIGMRNRLIHAYFDINYDIVWKTAKSHLPTLCCQLEEIISEFEKQ